MVENNYDVESKPHRGDIIIKCKQEKLSSTTGIRQRQMDISTSQKLSVTLSLSKGRQAQRDIVLFFSIIREETVPLNLEHSYYSFFNNVAAHF